MKRRKKRSPARHPSQTGKQPSSPGLPHPADRPSAPGRWPIYLGVLCAVVLGLVLVPIACGSRSAGTRVAAAGLPTFDSVSAWNYLDAQIAFGVRPVGTPAHEKLKDYLAARMRESTRDVQLQQWTDPTINLPLTNVIARFSARSGASGG